MKNRPVRAPTDPLEQEIAVALDAAGVEYIHESTDNQITQGLDFYLPDYDTFIEVKRFHAPRISNQMARVDSVIVLQGIEAVLTFVRMLDRVR